jgi:hypothetical protein
MPVRAWLGFAFTGLLALSYPEPARSSPTEMQTAVLALQEGRFAEAVLLLEAVLRGQPGNQGARVLLDQARQKQAAALALRNRLQSVIFPVFDSNDVSLNEALDYLAQQTNRLSSGSIQLNLVRIYPREFGEDTRVTLSVSNMPLPELLHYLGELARVRFEYDSHAIRVIPLHKNLTESEVGAKE